MNATKRKFNALLQGIGGKPSSPASNSTDANTRSAATSYSPSAPRRSTTISGTTPDLDPNMPLLSSTKTDLLKRRRVGAPDSSPVQTITAAGLPTVLLRKTNGTSGRSGLIAQDKTPLTTPRYCPADRDQLIKRLATFQELTDWTPKPDRVNEIEWAKRGWVCMGKERLRCTLCHKEIVVKLNRKEVEGKEVPVLVASEIEDAVADKYVELMVTSHQDDCLWRERGCDDHLIRLPLANPATALEALRKRYDELCARKDFLPYEFNLRLPEELDLDAVLYNLPPTFFSDPPPPAAQSATTPNRTALALAVLGWQGLENPKIGAVPNSASCHTCLRRLGLWMFKSKEVDQDTGAVLVPAMMDHLDPLREHRSFCPWKDGQAQRSKGTTPSSKSKAAAACPSGWEVLVQVTKNDSYLRSRSTNRLFGHKGSKSVGGKPAAADGPGTDNPGQPTTPVRPTTSGQHTPGHIVDDEDIEEDEATRDAKDKERWARLRRVKSLFDSKGKNKLKRSQSRPGTGHGSTPRPDTSNEQTG